MIIISEKISLSDVKKNYMNYFSSMIKVDVDVERRIIALDAELHADLEALLMDNGSKLEYIWGVNLFPDRPTDDCIEFTSMINIRPLHSNLSMEVEDPALRTLIWTIIRELIDFAA